MTHTTFARRRRKAAVLHQQLETTTHILNLMKSWKTTLVGAALAGFAFLSIYQANGGDLTHWQQWVIPFCIAMLGYLAKDSNVSGVVPLLWMPGLCILTLAACSTSSTGEKTFLGITRAGWVKSGKAAVISAGPVLMQERARTAAKQPVNVQP
jgi:hypothetical protein